jgi:Partial alpha/beta-hydrolase lipase region
LHRIPSSSKATNNGQKKKPVYLQHGVADSSAAFLTSSTDIGLRKIQF